MLPAFLWSSIKNKSGIWDGILQPDHHGKELQPVFIAPGDMQRKGPPAGMLLRKYGLFHPALQELCRLFVKKTEMRTFRKQRSRKYKTFLLLPGRCRGLFKL